MVMLVIVRTVMIVALTPKVTMIMIMIMTRTIAAAFYSYSCSYFLSIATPANQFVVVDIGLLIW